MKFLIFNFLLFCSLPLFSQNKAESLPMESDVINGKLAFVDKTYNFGKIRKGEKVTTSFYYKNTGTKSINILQVQTSCGCTITEWSKKIIEVGKTGEISVTFDSNEKEDIIGQQNKVILVISNATNKEEKLTLQGEVEKK
ncbi:MAG: DUF1573 domain-containing protein [Bacteroidetes bacterium]|nr:MAG: DUF1573 domain-containing protein [Bacteroidota bacterium]TAG85920.1 MAG: DUF1573 domain-containing protein [Bacteroidota bacterium]